MATFPVLDPHDIVASTLLWHDSIDRQLTVLRETSKEYATKLKLPSDPKCRVCLLLVEPREHPWSEFVIRNWTKMCVSLGASLMIAHGSTNGGFMKEICKDFANVQYLDLGVPDLPIERYNLVLTDPRFWANMPHEHLLLIQTDTMCLQPPNLDELEAFDYVGAPWTLDNPATKRTFDRLGPRDPVGVVDGHAMPELWPSVSGNGGLSWRKRSAMIKICEAFQLQKAHDLLKGRLSAIDETSLEAEAIRARLATPVLTSKVGERPIQNEDVMFAVGCRRVDGLRLGTREVSARFSCECIRPEGFHLPTATLCGLHKVYIYQPTDTVRHLLALSQIDPGAPEAPDWETEVRVALRRQATKDYDPSDRIRQATDRILTGDV